MPQAFTPILNIATTANTYGLDQNCYYCTVAALSNMTVDDFFHISQIMQQDTATPDEVIHLWTEGGVLNADYKVFKDIDTINNEIIDPMLRNSGLGLGYSRKDGTGHMVVLAKDDSGVVQCVDYQQNPPALTDFPPEPEVGINRWVVFYKMP